MHFVTPSPHRELRAKYIWVFLWIISLKVPKLSWLRSFSFLYIWMYRWKAWLASKCPTSSSTRVEFQPAQKERERLVRDDINCNLYCSYLRLLSFYCPQYWILLMTAPLSPTPTRFSKKFLVLSFQNMTQARWPTSLLRHPGVPMGLRWYTETLTSKTFSEYFTLHWDMSFLNGSKWSQYFKQPTRIVKFHLKYFYRFGSRFRCNVTLNL